MTAKSELMLTPTKALNTAYQKQKLGRNQVYELYGLTDEEIKIVEESVK